MKNIHNIRFIHYSGLASENFKDSDIFHEYNLPLHFRGWGFFAVVNIYEKLEKQLDEMGFILYTIEDFINSELDPIIKNLYLDHIGYNESKESLREIVDKYSKMGMKTVKWRQYHEFLFPMLHYKEYQEDKMINTFIVTMGSNFDDIISEHNLDIISYELLGKTQIFNNYKYTYKIQSYLTEEEFIEIYHDFLPIKISGDIRGVDTGEIINVFSLTVFGDSGTFVNYPPTLKRWDGL